MVFVLLESVIHLPQCYKRVANVSHHAFHDACSSSIDGSLFNKNSHFVAYNVGRLNFMQKTIIVI